MAAENAEIAALLQNWGFWRDQGEWEKLRGTFHPDGTIEVTWFRGRFGDFVDASIELRKKRRGGKHWIGGSRVEVRGERAVAETNVIIMGRQVIHGVEADSTAWGRFHDLLEKRGRWAICRRVAIYEKDRLDPVTPGAVIAFDAQVLAGFPPAYRHLGYALSLSGVTISPDLPTNDSPALERLRREGEDWLKGA